MRACAPSRPPPPPPAPPPPAASPPPPPDATGVLPCPPPAVADRPPCAGWTRSTATAATTTSDTAPSAAPRTRPRRRAATTAARPRARSPSTTSALGGSGSGAAALSNALMSLICQSPRTCVGGPVGACGKLMVGQHPAELIKPARGLALDGAGAAAQRGGGLFDREVEQVAEHDGGAHPRRQAPERTEDRGLQVERIRIDAGGLGKLGAGALAAG